METPTLSVVVPTYDRCESLRRMLDSLRAQRLPAAAFEVIVADDGSSDGTRAMAEALQTPFRLTVLSQANAGPAAARNLGVSHARGEIVVFLDDDVVAPPQLLEAHAARHASHADAVVIGSMLPPDGWDRPAWIRWEEDKLLRQYHAMQAGEWECTARQFYTGNASLRRARFVEAGGFDGHYRRAEDVELAYRLSARGVRFVFAPEASVLHYPRRTFAAWRRTPYQYGRYDVEMERDGARGTLANATREFHTRHPLNRWAARLCVGRPLATRVGTALLSGAVLAADRAGARRPAGAALSALFQLLYWQGVADALGGAAPLWHAIERAAPGRASAPAMGSA